jgi:AsmA family
VRDILTVLAVILVIVLSAALAVPYFVDWDAERSLVETQLSNLLGQQVKIRGGIDLKLLPTPYLQLADVEVVDPAAGTDIRAAELHLEIALTALMRGDVDFVEARLVRPQLRLRIENESLRLPAPPRALSQEQMQFERISVEDGTIAIDDPATGRNFTFKGIALDAEAGALTGPFTGDGRFDMGGEPTAFRFSTGEREGDRLHFKLILDENGSHPGADLDANLIFAQQALPSVDGAINLSGHTRDVIALPWHLSGSLQANLRKAAISNLDLRLGDEDHVASLNGAAAFDLGDKPRVNLELKAQQIDLDKLLTAEGAPPAMQRLADALGSLVKSKDLVTPGLALAVELSADSVLLGGETVSGIGGALAISGKEPSTLRFDADGPGRSHLSADGTVETGVAPGFAGHMEASAADVPRLEQWLAENLPQTLPAGLSLPTRSFAISGAANISEVGFVGSNLSLRLDGSTLSGTLAYTKALGPEAARLFADLAAPALALDSLPDLSALAGQTKAMDLALRLDAQAVKVSGTEAGEIDAGRILLKFDRTGPNAKLEELAVTGIDGANLTASGQWDGQGGRIAVKLDAERLEGLVGLARRFAPGGASDFLAARAEVFSPAHLNLGADAKINGDTIGLNGLSLTGTAGQTNISGKADPDPQNPADFSLSLRFDAKDSIALLRQIGFSTLPQEGLGPGSVEATAHGGHHLDTSVAALLAGANFTFNGTIDPNVSAPHATGTVKLASGDLSSLMRAMALARPDLAARLPADVGATLDAGNNGIALGKIAGTFAGGKIGGRLAYTTDKGITGALDTDAMSLATLVALALGAPQPPKPGALWSDLEFAPVEINLPPTNLAMSVAHFDLWPQISGRDAQFDLAIAGGETGLEFAIHHLAMKLGAGRVDADLTLRRSGPNAAAQGHLSLRDYALDLPSARGLLSADLDLAGTGDSASALVAGFAGSGTIGFFDLVLPKSDPGALARVFDAVEQDQLGIDEAEIDRVLLAEFAKQPLSLGDAKFDAGLAAGVLRLSQKGATTIPSGVIEDLGAAVDLHDLTLAQTSALSLAAVPKHWNGALPQVELSWNGDIANPTQSLDAASFVNALAARAIARQSARIQAQEFDVHEHAFFLSRLQSERRREAGRLKAEEDARRAAELVEPGKSEATGLGQNAEDTKSKDEATGNATPATPVQIVRPVPMPPRRPTWPAPAPAADTTAFPDPSAAGRY